MANINYAAQIRTLAQKVAQARHIYEQCKEILDDAKQTFEQANAHLFEMAQVTRKDQLEAETHLRELTLKAFAATENKTPWPGVAVKIMTQVFYDKALAMAWATEHRVCLQLDTKAFEAFAKVNPAQMPFVEVRQEPQATIAKDLEKVLDDSKDHLLTFPPIWWL